MYKDINEAMLGLSVWKKHRRTSVKPISKNIAYKPTFNADFYRETAIYRFIELAESAFHLYKANLLVGATVTARAAQETLAVVWFINSKLEHLAKTEDLAHFSEIMRRLIVGWSNNEEFPEKINVLKCIDSVDKVMGGEFRRHYDILCEYAHPNYSGTLGTYGQLKHETLEVTIGENPNEEETLRSHIESTLKVCIALLDLTQKKYEEVFNGALEVCHQLHKQGKLKEQLKGQPPTSDK